ncbi:MAG: sulfopyruvate decarboxylase subunit alpha [Candidatus Methanoplasma sp.]|jgi:sulfopyruvate decarboxylase subunit beta|nr:sulfopyruvate decarboxylase subunit alpha [Candidatus Methanoplasma sp.]
MHEDQVVGTLKRCGIDTVVSLPCDKNRRLTSELHLNFRTIDITREEDGVGICAGICLAGKRPVMSIQSSGLGNMMNALMSLTSLYEFPLPILASWRGVENETIPAQIPFNIGIEGMLRNYGVPSVAVRSADDLDLVYPAVKDAFDRNTAVVVLIAPSVWGEPPPQTVDFPSRRTFASLRYEREFPEPRLSRLEAIKAIESSVDDETVVVSNIGVPSKEVFACGDRPLNFYMLGSYTQATPIGLGIALSSSRRVVVIDGDGSLLGSSVLPVAAAESPPNLTILCLDNGTFGSTGNQLNPAYAVSDLELAAKAYGIEHTCTVNTSEGISSAVSKNKSMFVRALIRPGNSDSPNIPLDARTIKDRFIAAARRP